MNGQIQCIYLCSRILSSNKKTKLLMYAIKLMNPENIIVWFHLCEMSREHKVLDTKWGLSGAGDGAQMMENGLERILGEWCKWAKTGLWWCLHKSVNLLQIFKFYTYSE